MDNGCYNVPDGDVEDVRSHWRRDGHVAFALLGHKHARDQVGNGGAGRQKRQAHDLLKDEKINEGGRLSLFCWSSKLCKIQGPMQDW